MFIQSNVDLRLINQKITRDSQSGQRVGLNLLVGMCKLIQTEK